MASPRTRRVLQDLKQTNENSVSESGLIHGLIIIIRLMKQSSRFFIIISR